MSETAVMEKTAQMPTKLKRISVALDDEAYAKLAELALIGKRSVANMSAVLIEAALFPGGRVAPRREEKRGGKRSGAGRPKSTQAEAPTDAE